MHPRRIFPTRPHSAGVAKLLLQSENEEEEEERAKDAQVRQPLLTLLLTLLGVEALLALTVDVVTFRRDL